MTKYGENYNFIESKQLVEKKDGTTIIQQGEKDTDKHVKSGKIVEDGKTQKLVLDITDKEGNVSNVDITLPSYLKDSDIVNNAVIKTAITEELAKLDDKYALKTKLEELGLKVEGIKLEEKDPIWLKEKIEYLKTADADKKYLTEHQSLEDYAKKTDIPKIPTKVSELDNDKNYLTEHQSLEEYAKKTELPKVPTKISAFENDKNYLTEHQSLDDYAKKTDIKEVKVPTKTSELTNDSGFLTKHQDISNLLDKTEASNTYLPKEKESEIIGKIPTKVGQLTNDKNYLTEHQSLEEYAKKTELPKIPTKVSAFENDRNYLTEHQKLDDYLKKSELPNIPTKTSELTNDSNFISEHQSLEDYAKKTDIPKIPTKVSVFENDANYLTEHQNLDDYAKKSELTPLLTSEKADSTFVKTVSLEYEKENGALSVVVNGNKNTVELPMDKFLKEVSLDKDKKNIVFSFNDKDNSSIKLPTTDLITTYVGGDGIKVVDTTISLDPNKLNLLLTKTEAEEEYLKIVDKPKVPTKVGELENDKNYITSHQSLADYAKKSELPTSNSQLTNDKNFITKDEVANSYLPKTKEAELLAKIPTKTSDLTNDEGFLTEHQSLADYAKKSELHDKVTKVGELENDKGYLVKSDLNEYAKKSELPQEIDLSPYAKKSELPTKTSDLTNDSGFLKEHQSLKDYVKTSELPVEKTKLSEFKNDEQFVTDTQVSEKYALKTDIPTKTSLLDNDSGFLTEHQPLTDYVKKTELSDYATKTDIAKLTNIDTELKEDSDNLVTNKAITKVIIDNEEVVAALVNDLNTRINQKIDTKQLYEEFVIKTEKHEEELTELTIKPNKYYQLGTVKKLTLTLSPIEDDKRYNEYMVEFVSGTEPTQLILPPQVKWIGSDVITTNRKYQLSIVNDLAVIGGSKLVQTN